MKRKPKAGARSIERKQTGMPTQPVSKRAHSRRTVALICAGLAMLVLGVFSQTLRHEFVNYDDDDYVYMNPAVTGGLTWKGFAWAFTHVHSGNWHPVTWLSHMLDCELYGLAPWGHHLTSVLLHAATVVLLFLALRQLTSDACRSPGESLPVRRGSKSEGVWCSAFVAALFAIHPLRVESVAWVAERKDVLSGLFFMLTLLAYARYAKHPFSIGRYLAVVVFFALGLMSKPMLVTLPFVLLLLDYWPLGRLPADSSISIRHSAFLISEKLPLFAMSAASCVVTMLAQAEARMTVEKLPMLWRFGNALVAYATYLGQTAWPAGLAVFYPHPVSRLPISAASLSFILLAAVSAAVFALRRKLPCAVTGWLWYLGMLVPVIGLMQVGSQAHADRYSYLPQIGLFIALTWGLMEVSIEWRQRRKLCVSGATLVLAMLAGCAWIQTAYWRDSVTLWTRALDCTSGNDVAHNNLGNVLAAQGKSAEAVEHFLRALRINPDYADAHNNLGNALVTQGNPAEATEHYLRALEIKPDHAKAHNNLGGALAAQGKLAEAAEHCLRALKIDPDYADAQLNLGSALAAQGKFADVIEHYSKVLETAPDTVAVIYRLGWILATCPEAPLRNGPKAIELARKAERLVGGGNPAVLDTLAAAYAEAGQFPEAVETARRALDLAEKGNDRPQAEDIRTRLRLYERGMPYHEEPRKR